MKNIMHDWKKKYDIAFNQHQKNNVRLVCFGLLKNESKKIPLQSEILDSVDCSEILDSVDCSGGVSQLQKEN